MSDAHISGMLAITYHELWRKNDIAKARKCKKTSVELEQGRKITLRLRAHPEK
jgi:hypothetical protein